MAMSGYRVPDGADRVRAVVAWVEDSQCRGCPNGRGTETHWMCVDGQAAVWCYGSVPFWGVGGGGPVCVREGAPRPRRARESA